MQETYIKLWNRASQFQPGQGAAMGWVMTIARNHALDRIRARPGRAQGMRAVDPCPDAQAEGEASDPIAALADTAPSAFAQVAAEEDARKLLDCFDTLEAARAQAVRGAYLDGLSYADLSDRLGIPLNTVRTWLRRGLQTLRECMDR